MRIAREEIFGPVVSIIPFDTEAEAIRIANATPYGLSGSVWSRDIGKALRAAKGIQAGVLSVNSNNSVHTEAPFGGYKMSGIGRELGMHALELYTEIKNVFIDLALARGPRASPAGLADGLGPRGPAGAARASRGAPTGRPERDPAHGMASGAKACDLERLRASVRASPPDDPRLEGEHDDRRLQPRVQPDDLARLDDRPGLLERLADRRLGRPSRRPRGSRPAGPTSRGPARSRAGAGPPRRRR